MPWKPSFEGEVPTLGFAAIDWITEMLAAPDAADYEPLVPYLEQEDFFLRWYELDVLTCRYRRHRGVLGRPRGWGKSPILGAVAILEALGDIVPDGWDANGQPVGRPWKSIRTPLVHIAAVSEEQTNNTWTPIMEMLREDAPIHDHYAGIEPFEAFVALGSGRGKIDKITSSSRTIKGARPVFSVLDQTEEWVVSNGGVKLANTMRANAAKVGGRTLESPNAYIPGEGSVAEGSAAFWHKIRIGKAKDEGLLYDHREAPADTDMGDRDSLIKGLRFAYGDSSGHPDGCTIHEDPCAPGHVDLDRLVQTIWDPEQDVQQSRSDFLNQITHASDSWISQPEWRSIYDENASVEDGEQIALGFDGSRGRNRGNADATALIACRLSDGLLFEVGVWEARYGEKDWLPSMMEVDTKVAMAMERWRVCAFSGDPSGWQEPMARWEAKYGRRLKVKASQQNPIAAWPRGKDSRVETYVETFRRMVVNRELRHDGSPSLTRHVLNARKRTTRTGYLIHKAYPDSPDKIDAAYAAVMALKARTDCLRQGLGKPKRDRILTTTGPRRGRVVIS
jgi:hypothetical protein